MQQNLFTEGEMTTSRPTITKPNVSRSTFYHGDCLIEMDKIADKSVDMILCDLPYGTTQCKWDVVIPFHKLWEQYERIIKDNCAIVLSASQPFTSTLVISNKKLFKYEWIWHKNKGGNPLNALIQPMKQHENILVFGKGKIKYIPIREERLQSGKDRIKSRIKGGNIKENAVYGETNIIFKMYDETRLPQTVQYFNVERGLHPTQKPVSLMEYLIKTYTNEGETVLDNCMGSGTTGVACRNTNRHFIGIEQDKKYFDIAVKRIMPIIDFNESTCQHYLSKNKTGICDNCGKNLICHWKSFG